MITFRRDHGIKVIFYPDNQPHIQLEEPIMPRKDRDVRLVWPICSSQNLVELLLIADALEAKGYTRQSLYIPYLMGARSDRHMVPGDSFDLRQIARIINLAGFKSVEILEPHSDVAIGLINGSRAVHSADIQREYRTLGASSVIIIPDEGMKHRIYDWPSKSGVTYCTCTKSRDLATGHITLEVNEPKLCAGKPCVIIDDLCDGGGTFIKIAEQIIPSSLTLIVTHGIFSKGVKPLFRAGIDMIITTDSYPSVAWHPCRLIRYCVT